MNFNDIFDFRKKENKMAINYYKHIKKDEICKIYGVTVGSDSCIEGCSKCADHSTFYVTCTHPDNYKEKNEPIPKFKVGDKFRGSITDTIYTVKEIEINSEPFV